MSLVISRFVVCMHSHHGQGESSRGSHHCLDRPTHLLSILGLMVESLLFGMFTCCMMADQWDVVMSNMTHIDRLKGEMLAAAAERVPGVLEVFGAGRRGIKACQFRMDWLSPFAQVFFPPSIRDEIMGYCRPCGGGGGVDRRHANTSTDEELLVELTAPTPSSGRGMVRSVNEIV